MQMNKNDALQIIAGIKDSIVGDPAQFHIAVNVTGQKTVSHGGTGLHIQAIGGAPGSRTIGQQVSVAGSHIEIGQQRGLSAMEQQLHALVEALDTIIEQLKTETPDRSVVSRAYESLKGTWVPGVITSVLEKTPGSKLHI
jgi:hypothetical protein